VQHSGRKRVGLIILPRATHGPHQPMACCLEGNCRARERFAGLGCYCQCQCVDLYDRHRQADPTPTPSLMRWVRYYHANKHVFRRRLKAAAVEFGLLTGSGRLFQADGPAVTKARGRPYEDKQTTCFSRVCDGRPWFLVTDDVCASISATTYEREWPVTHVDFRLR